MSDETSYGAGYPFAIEAVYAQRLGDTQNLVGKWVKAATVKTFKAVARSGAVINTDAADGRDISIKDFLGETLTPRAMKEARQYLNAKGKGNYSRMTRAQQERLLTSIAELVSPGINDAIAFVREAAKDGLYGDIPAFTISEVGRLTALYIIRDMEKSIGINGASYIEAVNIHADKIQDSIINRKFGLDNNYWDNYYKNHVIESFPLTNITKNIPATPDTGGAVIPGIKKYADRVSAGASVLSLPSTATANNQLYETGADNFRLIIRAASGVELDPEVELSKEDLAELISVDIYDGDDVLKRQTAEWLESTMGRMENVTEDAIQRGIKTVQRGLMEGRSADYIAAQLETEMEIPYRRARNVARNEIGNQSWNLEEANARRGNMRYYRWHGMLDERERKLHVEREDKPYTPDAPPSDGNPGQPHGCRCFPEWLFARADVEKARLEIEKRNAARNAGKH